MLWNDFQGSWRVDLSGHAKEKAQEEPQAHADIFVHHAKVYVLGDRYRITALMEVSFDKLHRALVDYTVSESRLNDIVALLRYCYTELSPDRLKRFVVHYAACKVKKLWKSVEFQQLLEEHGSMSRALVELLLLKFD
ncbi:hypothetical protein TOPH_08906 [Tolypocladium ophioglossoides CBS 100239]|uniref:BTB domain-containing protein n=1 Tax=Tolypocladium ophioglossoides (strain CBS 100239) TaxID=1163406 RepID=A0A0L0MX32_TOLOC|nr:hypothetical protein TOPH_08906 [Tolypocladium ophioglossoides CBS 100239]